MIEEYERRLGGMTIGFLEGLSKRKTRPVKIVKSSNWKKSYFYRCWMPSSTCSRHWDNVFPGGTLSILNWENAFTFLFSWSKGFNSKWPIVPALARPSGGCHWSWSGPDPWHGRSLPRQPSSRSRQVFKTLHTFLWSEGFLEGHGIKILTLLAWIPRPSSLLQSDHFCVNMTAFWRQHTFWCFPQTFPVNLTTAILSLKAFLAKFEQ